MVSEKLILVPPSSSNACRVSYNGTRGTVAYVGPVNSLNGVWYGVDWDDPTRGKHDGTFEGTKYFNTSSKTSGSFVHPSKLQFGCNVYDALVEKYQTHNLQELDGNVWGSKEIEFVGMEKICKKQSQLQKLRHVVLDDSLVARCGTENLTLLLPNVVELHMCNTLLFEWSEILAICRQLPNLKHLNLSKNRLRNYNRCDFLAPIVLPSVRTLWLNEIGITWPEVLSLASVFPNLVEFGLCKNSIHYLTDLPYPNLTWLDLSSNPIIDWKEVLKLGTLTKLESLNLSETGISYIELPPPIISDNRETIGLFKSLKVLYLCDNKIDNWMSINELDKLPRLEHVLLHRNPVMLTESPETSRQLVIAKIGRLKMLDRWEIISQERRGAELDYLKRYGKAWYETVASGDSSLLEKFLLVHPRYLTLVKKHGPAEQSEVKVTHDGVLKNKLIDLNFKCSTKAPIARKIPSDMTVVKLKGLLARLFSLDARSIRLCYECAKRPETVIEIDNDFRKLDFYSLENGDTIFVTTTSGHHN